MKVYVINQHEQPLMPTTPRKARLLLKTGKAIIHSRNPFTLQLIYGSSGYTQPVSLGIDSGYETIGFSAVNDREELIGGEGNLLKGVSQRLSEKRQYRRQRRNQKRHRKPRFDKRKRPQGWLAPSIQHKLDTHHKLINRVKRILPVKQVVIEVAAFDTQKINNPDIHGQQYQQGQQHGFSHLREYILHRDAHKCQNPNCQNKAKQPILQVHHLGYWKGDRSDRPGNLVTLCHKCHTPANHKLGKLLHGWQPKVKSMRPAAFMSIVWKRLAFESAAKFTFGADTKDKRRECGLEKSHHNDAFVIAGGTTQQQRYPTMQFEQIRRNKRSLEQFYDAKYIDIRDGQVKSGTELSSGRRTRNKNLSGENLRQYRGHKVTAGRRAIKRQRYPYKQHDLVLFEGRIYPVVGMQSKGKRVSLKPYPDCPTKYKTASVSAVIPIRKLGGICCV